MLQAIKYRVLLVTLALVNACNPAHANPTGPAVVNGNPTFSGLGTGNLQITNTRGTIINWSDFSIGAGELTRFIQPDAVSAVLNRVTGANPSNILGTLISNGRVFIINPNGIIFGTNAVIDVQGLVASTLDISDNNFLAGTYNFVAGDEGNITLQNGASITTATTGDGGQVWLFANNIDQQGGSITTPAGQAILAAGRRVQVTQSNLGNMIFTVLTNNNNNINTLGTIAADRGVAGLFADNITHAGTIYARSSGGVQGIVVIEADDNLTVADDNPATLQKEGVINVNSLDATNGGTINLTASNQIEILPLAEVSADGGPTGSNGGVIRLRANDLRVSPVANGRGNLHARGVNGSVTLTETGTSTYEAEGETQITNTTDGNQGQLPDNLSTGGGTSKVTTLADGRYIVVWAGEGTGDTAGVFGRLFNANGTPVGNDFRINPDFGNQANTPQGLPQVTALKNGNFVVTWSGIGTEEIADSGVFGQIYNNSGASVGAPFLVNTFTTGNQAAAPITALADGGFVISWASEGQDGDSWGVYGQRYDANGTRIGNEFQVNSTTAGNQGGLQGVSSVTGLADGGFVITWGSKGQDQAAVPLGNVEPLVEKDDNAFGIYGQRYDVNGNPVGSEFRVNTTTILSQQEPKVTGLSNGGFVVTWAGDQDIPLDSGSGLHEAIFAQRYDATGNPVGAEFQVNGYNQLDQESPAVTALADGGFVVTWQSLGQEGVAESGRGVYGKRYKADGTAVGGEFQVNSITADNQWYSDVSALSDGDFVVTWSSVGQDGSGSGIYGQRYSKNVSTLNGNNRVTNELTPAAVGFNTRPTRQNANFIPTAGPTTVDLLSTAPNTPIAIPAPSDQDKDILTATIDALPDVTQGSVLLPDGVTGVTQGQTLTAAQLIGLQFKPTTTASTGTQTLRYTVKDGQGGVVPQTATINITAVTTPPIIPPDPTATPPVVIPGNPISTPPTSSPPSSQPSPVPVPNQPGPVIVSPSTPDDDSSSVLAEIEQGLGIASGLCSTAERESDPVTNSTLNRQLCQGEQRDQLNTGEAVIQSANLQLGMSKQEKAYAQMVGEAEYTLTRQLSWKARQAYWDERQQKQETLTPAAFNTYLNRIRNLSEAQRVRYYEQLAQ